MAKFPVSFLLFLFHFLSLNLSSSAYTLPTQYFINCGSDTNVVSTRRTFTGDSNSDNSLTLTGQSSSVKEPNNSKETPQLYQTSRIFKEKFSYEFKITNSSTYLVRFHFFKLNSSANFAVSVSGFSLLSNFTVQNSKNKPNLLLIEEFFVGISEEKFIIQFLPQEFSFGFVNAIELFPTPANFIPDNAPLISPMGSSSNFNGVLSKALHTIQRINVGGLTLTPDNDTLWRNWVPDDSFLYMSDTAKNSKFHGDKPKYTQGVNEYFAPDLVYQTAKEMNINHVFFSNNFNITWSVEVSKNARHFVRVHFCDIISQSIGDLAFNLYVYRNFSREIVPYQMSDQLAVPFFFDFVVDSDDSGLMNISIGPRRDSKFKTAFLNGLEIMEIVGESGLVLETREAKKIPILVIVGSILGGLALISVFAAVLCLCLWCRKQKTVESLDWPPVPVYRAGSSRNRVPEGTFVSSRVDLNVGLRICFAEILLATNNFDAKMIVGKGGFGHVFRGTLRNGTKVAVKRCESGSGQGLPEFETEITVLSKLRHRHLVSLIGYCDELSEMILVYEFMEKGTLKDHLYNSSSPPFSWRQRLEICIGAAKGLHYLHRGNSGGFIHRDVKSTNILLDEYLVAKVADFGLSRIGPPDQSHVSTCVKGTLGYLDPDYFRTQQLTEKSDVYSFGVVLLEVLCARPAIDVSLPQEQVNLAEWGLFCKNNGTLEQIVDPSIKEQINPNSLRKFGEIAENCLQEYGTDRPAMGDVVWDLEYTLQLQQTAVQREPHEDSASDASSMLALPNIQRFPSIGMSIEEDDTPILAEHSSNMWASEVFSQLRIDDAR
ncbi:probable receptor-like protein kinase At5g24010 [Mercurialis annua]|uniref:probable receptor-like protein kinase At5g24010 n=1 Tax=Mercurialis annua TaxID=3986 RepID=UPI002160EA35|nr:probable receptor-like protein kinase At5g24010 [Mercurialis annua]